MLRRFLRPDVGQLPLNLRRELSKVIGEVHWLPSCVGDAGYRGQDKQPSLLRTSLFRCS